MKKALGILLLSLSLVLSGCVSNSTLNEVKANLASAEDKVSQLESELAKSNQKAAELEKRLDELKNGPQMSIVQIRKEFESKNYDQVLTLSAELHKRFTGVPEDQEAQGMVKQIEETRRNEAKKAEEEKARLLAEQAKSAEEKARSILRVSSVYPSKPNSAGGVDFYVIWKNNSDQVIKYIVFEVQPYNAVGDVVSSEIGNRSTYRGQSTGPFKKGQGNDGNSYWENAWYNNTIKTVKLNRVEIEYMDGTKVALKDEDVKHIQY
jgi:outer membrane murein-binding lipoprotein Lpp